MCARMGSTPPISAALTFDTLGIHTKNGCSVPPRDKLSRKPNTPPVLHQYGFDRLQTCPASVFQQADNPKSLHGRDDTIDQVKR